jgi:hypothetical protein
VCHLPDTGGREYEGCHGKGQYAYYQQRLPPVAPDVAQSLKKIDK